jgi:serine/threonine protein kinase
MRNAALDSRRREVAARAPALQVPTRPASGKRKAPLPARPGTAGGTRIGMQPEARPPTAGKRRAVGAAVPAPPPAPKATLAAAAMPLRMALPARIRTGGPPRPPVGRSGADRNEPLSSTEEASAEPSSEIGDRTLAHRPVTKEQLPSGYTLLRVVGSQTSAASPVVLAKHWKKGGPGAVAIKSAFGGTSNNPEAYRAISVELQALRAMESASGTAAGACYPQHVVRLLDVIEGERATHLILEPCLGGSLRELMLPCPDDDEGLGGGMAERDAHTIASQIASALEALHAAGIAHRALSPEACYFADAERTVLKVGSVGFSEVACAQRPSDRVGSLVAGPRAGAAFAAGLPQYRAPEAWLTGPAPYEGPPADIWSFGAIVYELLHGRPAFDSETLPRLSLQIRRVAHRSIAPCVSASAAALVRACFVREPMMRAGPKQMLLVYLRAWQRDVGA